MSENMNLERVEQRLSFFIHFFPTNHLWNDIAHMSTHSSNLMLQICW